MGHSVHRFVGSVQYIFVFVSRSPTPSFIPKQNELIDHIQGRSAGWVACGANGPSEKIVLII